ncbi:hypothetical protein AYO38_04680 [bacterium SCGC AG-212-C10]|nr:hypothetical protein AYO38_04680 [bacterium SCGC AG-212-C10]
MNANGSALTLNTVEEIVKRAGVRAGIPRLTCHLLRHTFATTYLVKELGDPLRLQQILGHTSLEMVRHYVGMANIQPSLIERRASAMEVVLAGRVLTNQSRMTQPRRPRTELSDHRSPVPARLRPTTKPKRIEGRSPN